MDDVMGAPYDEMLHEAEAQLEATDAAGDTPLATAIKHGQVDAVRQLIELGCDINAVMGDSRSCLMIASDLGPEHHDRGSIVSALLDAGAAVDARDDAGRTALMFAARGDPLDAVTALIHAGADVNAATEAGVTSLMYACCYTCDNCCVSLACDTAVVGALLAAGADVHAEDEDGRTAIFAAANVGAADLVEQLVNAGGPHTLNKQATDGSTALLYATLPPFSPLPHANHAAVVACLLRLGTAALAWVHDVLGNTPLHSAIMNHCSTNIIQQLLDHGAPREARIIGSDDTPLHCAAATGQAEVISLLLKAGASVAAVNTDGDTCLSIAGAAGHTAAVTQLLQAWDTPPVDVLRRAVESAAEGQHWQAALLLLKQVGQQDLTAGTELMHAFPGVLPALWNDVMASPFEQQMAELQRQHREVAEEMRALQHLRLALAAMDNLPEAGF